MNSAAKRLRVGAVVLTLAGLAAAFISAGCADHGPTNLYSQPLFGQTQAGAHLEVWTVQYSSLSKNAGTSDLVGYVVYLKNTGSGGTVGPIRAALSVTSCATVNQATASFGTAGQVINPGVTLRGQGVDSGGNVINSQFAFEATDDLTAGCNGSTIDFTVAATDPYGSTWNSGFTAVSQ